MKIFKYLAVIIVCFLGGAAFADNNITFLNSCHKSLFLQELQVQSLQNISTNKTACFPAITIGQELADNQAASPLPNTVLQQCAYAAKFTYDNAVKTVVCNITSTTKIVQFNSDGHGNCGCVAFDN